jgi:hypothetical protein
MSIEGTYAPEANVIFEVGPRLPSALLLEGGIEGFVGLGLNVTNVKLGLPSHLGLARSTAGVIGR